MLPDSDETSERELMQRLVCKEARALEEVYERYGRIVYSMFLKITRNQSTAEDLVQDLFLRLWDRAEEFNPLRGRLANWVLSIARNLAIDYVRSGHAQFLLRIDRVDEFGFTEQPFAKDYEVLFNNNSLVERSLNGLTLNQRHVMELAYYQGFSQTEIAARMKVPLGTVKSWMRAALQCLRESMRADRTQPDREESAEGLQLQVAL